ncbi:MAG: hypothetical protein JRJ80_12055 [Deltaproteobacteria bacterium]|nr:hypothetical protein [Deltaproteobacteria bacterium]
MANALGAAKHCARLECVPSDLECDEVAGAFMRIFETDGCAAAIATGELEGLPGNASIQPAGPDAGNAKLIQEVICNSIAQCEFCGAAAALGVCGPQCF